MKKVMDADNSGDLSWGHLKDTEHFGRACSNYILVPKEELVQDKYRNCTHAGHCMIYAKSSEKIFGIYSARAAVLMQMRFDGHIGFPGGLIDDGEEVLVGLNRELQEEMHMDIKRHPVKEHHHIVSHWCPNKNLMLHFYAVEIPFKDLKSIEEGALRAHDYGTETLGTFRVPLYTMGDGFRGFPAFLKNLFVGNSQQQLLHSLVHLGLMSEEEITRAKESSPVEVSDEENERAYFKA